MIDEHLGLDSTIFVLLCIVSNNTSLSSQALSSFELNLEGEPLDIISSSEGSIHIITNQASYVLNNQSFDKISSHRQLLKLNSTNYDLNDSVYYYPSINKMYLPLKMSDKLPEINSISSDGIVLFQDQDILLIDKDLYRYELEKLDKILELPHQYSNYWDGDSEGQNIWFSNYGHGVIHIDHKLDLIEFTNENSLYNNDCSSILVDNGLVYVGHSGGLSIIKDSEISTVDLYPLIGNNPVLEIEKYEDTIWILSSEKILFGSLSNLQEINLELEKGDELRSIEVDKDSNIWILSQRFLFCVTDLKVIVYNDLSEEHQNIQLYKIRDNTYYTNGADVFKYDHSNNVWNLNPNKHAPSHISTDTDSNTTLIFKDKIAIKLHKANAKVLDRTNLPQDEISLNIKYIEDAKYFCTNKNLYQKSNTGFSLINSQTDQFFNILKLDHNLWVFGKSGIYKMGNNELIPILNLYNNTVFPKSINQFVLDHMLVSFDSSSLIMVDPIDEKATKLDLGQLNILDIKEVDDAVLVLTRKSLVGLKKENLKEKELNISFVKPLHQELTKGELFCFSDQYYWISANGNIIKIAKETEEKYSPPILFLDRIQDGQGRLLDVKGQNQLIFKKSDLPLTFHYNNTIHWTDNLQYT